MKNFNEEDIIRAIREAGVKPSADWQKKALSELRFISSEKTMTFFEKIRVYLRSWIAPFQTILSFNPFAMKKLISFLIVIALLVSAGYYYNRPLARATRHLNNAKNALTELNKFAQGGSFAMIIRQYDFAFASVSYAQETDAVTAEPASEPVADAVTASPESQPASPETGGTGAADPAASSTAPAPEVTTAEPASVTPETAATEATVQELVQTVTTETTAAIEAAQQIETTQTTETVLQDIAQVQTETVTTLSDVVEAVQTEQATVVVAAALETTVQQQEQVIQAIETVQTAAQSGETTVSIQIQTPDTPAVTAEKVKGKTLEEANAGFTAVKATLENLKKSGASAEEIAKLEGKLTKIEAAIADGKYGRAKGLSTALQAQSKHIIRKAEKAETKKAETTELAAPTNTTGTVTSETTAAPEVKPETAPIPVLPKGKDKKEAVTPGTPDEESAAKPEKGNKKTETVSPDSSAGAGDETSTKPEKGNSKKTEETVTTPLPETSSDSDSAKGNAKGKNK